MEYKIGAAADTFCGNKQLLFTTWRPSAEADRQQGDRGGGKSMGETPAGGGLTVIRAALYVGE